MTGRKLPGASVHRKKRTLLSMDPRISRWAKTLVNYCLEVRPGQTVLIDATPVAEPLVAEVYRETLRAGGYPIPQITLPVLERIALEDSTDGQLAWIDPVQKLLAREVDCRLSIAGATNTRRMATISGDRMTLRRRALS